MKKTYLNTWNKITHLCQIQQYIVNWLRIYYVFPIVHLHMNGDLCHKISNFNLQNWCWKCFLCKNQITMIYLLYKGVWHEERWDILTFISPPPGTPPNWRRGHFGARECHAQDVLPRLHRDTINILITGCEGVIAVCVLSLPCWFAAYCAWSWKRGWNHYKLQLTLPVTIITMYVLHKVFCQLLVLWGLVMNTWLLGIGHGISVTVCGIFNMSFSERCIKIKSNFKPTMVISNINKKNCWTARMKWRVNKKYQIHKNENNHYQDIKQSIDNAKLYIVA